MSLGVGALMGAIVATVLVLSNFGEAGAIAAATFGVVLAVGFGAYAWLKTSSIAQNKRKSTTQPETTV